MVSKQHAIVIYFCKYEDEIIWKYITIIAPNIIVQTNKYNSR